MIEDPDSSPSSKRNRENADRPSHWRGSLVDMRLMMLLAEDKNKVEIGPEPYPETLEIDRIVLRSGFGIPEQSLDLPEDVSAEFSGQWLDAGRFYPLDQRGLEWPIAGDLDGDGDLDLVVSYLLHDRDRSTWQGWITAFNDGKGRFASGEAQVLEHVEKYSSIVYLDGADVIGENFLAYVIDIGSRWRGSQIGADSIGGLQRMGRMRRCVQRSFQIGRYAFDQPDLIERSEFPGQVQDLFQGDGCVGHKELKPREKMGHL